MNGELRIGFFNKKFIAAGEEITFDYHFQRYGYVQCALVIIFELYLKIYKFYFVAKLVKRHRNVIVRLLIVVVGSARHLKKRKRKLRRKRNARRI